MPYPDQAGSTSNPLTTAEIKCRRHGGQRYAALVLEIKRESVHGTEVEDPSAYPERSTTYSQFEDGMNYFTTIDLAFSSVFAIEDVGSVIGQIRSPDCNVRADGYIYDMMAEEHSKMVARANSWVNLVSTQSPGVIGMEYETFGLLAKQSLLIGFPRSALGEAGQQDVLNLVKDAIKSKIYKPSQIDGEDSENEFVVRYPISSSRIWKSVAHDFQMMAQTIFEDFLQKVSECAPHEVYRQELERMVRSDNSGFSSGSKDGYNDQSLEEKLKLATERAKVEFYGRVFEPFIILLYCIRTNLSPDDKRRLRELDIDNPDDAVLAAKSIIAALG